MKVRVRPPTAEYLEFLAPFERRVIDLALAARALVLEEAPDACELTSWWPESHAKAAMVPGPNMWAR